MEIKKTSLHFRLILAFIMTSIIPMILYNLFSYYNTSKIVRSNVNELTYANLQQTKMGLNVWLESYEDILFQVYTDDDIVNLVRKINNGEELTLSKKQIRKIVRGLFYTKEYIKSISIITENGNVVFYDQLTGSTTQNSWLDKIGKTQQELYEEIAADNLTHVISTHQAGSFARDENYLFHLGHGIINYKKVEEKLGVVVVSMDEKMLKNICSTNDSHSDSFNFIVSLLFL